MYLHYLADMNPKRTHIRDKKKFNLYFFGGGGGIIFVGVFFFGVDTQLPI